MSKSISELKGKLIEEFNALNIPDMKRVTDLYPLTKPFRPEPALKVGF